jgi:hypothetical protein
MIYIMTPLPFSFSTIETWPWFPDSITSPQRTLTQGYYNLGWACWYMSIIPALGRKTISSLRYLMRHCLKKKED